MTPLPRTDALDANWLQWLEAQPVARLGTLNGAGAPHLVPVVFVLDEGQLWIPVDGKPKQGARLARLANIEHDSRCCVLVDTYSEDWSDLRWLRLDGFAEVVALSDEQAASLTKALSRKYKQYESVEPLPAPATAIRFVWKRVKGWRPGDAGFHSTLNARAMVRSGVDQPDVARRVGFKSRAGDSGA